MEKSFYSVQTPNLMDRAEILEALKDLIEVAHTAPGTSETFMRLLFSLQKYVGDH